jgi:glutaredoxin
MITVMLYSRKECHLCDVAKRDLDTLREEYPHKLVVVDIDEDPQLQESVWRAGSGCDGRALPA